MTCPQGYIIKIKKGKCSLQNLWLTSEYIFSELKLRLVKALVYPQFLFGNVLYRMADFTGTRKLEVAFNNCVRFVYGLQRYDQVSEYSMNMLGCSLSKYYEFRDCCMLFKTIKTTYPSYLNENLFFDSSRRQLFMERIFLFLLSTLGTICLWR
jgi:hypothetical protein